MLEYGFFLTHMFSYSGIFYLMSITKEYNRISLYTSADQGLNGEGTITSAEESESCDSENSQPPEPGHFKKKK